MKLYKNTPILFFFLFTSLGLFAQNQNRTTKLNMAVSSRIIDEDGTPVAGAKIYSSSTRMFAITDRDGNFDIEVTADDVLAVKADGYQTKKIKLAGEKIEKEIILQSHLPFSGEENVINLPFNKTTERRSVGAYSIVSGDELEKTPATTIESTLGGRLNGLFQLQNTEVPGWNTHTMYVRGGTGNYIVMVDGVERSLDYIDPEVIESVELLKDATSKALYGGLQANGILLITTKKGHPYENSVSVNVEQGIQMPTRLPDYLNAYEYATYYNKALANDGYEPLYDQEALNAYKNHTDPILYPDVDYYDYFLNKSYNITRANAQFSGGNEKNKYFAHIGYHGNGGLEKFTDYPNSEDVFTVRSSIEMKVLDFINFNAGFNGASQIKEWPNISTQNFFAPLSNHHPNQYPILIPGNLVGSNEKYVLGGTAEKQNNPYGLLTSGGYAEKRYTYVQSDFGLTFDFNQWIKGLKIKPFVSFDVYNLETATQGATFSVYEPVYNKATGETTFNHWGEDTKATSQTRSNALVERNYAVKISAFYDRDFGKHSIHGLLNFYQSRNEIRNVNEDPRRQNLGLRVNDMISDKYIVEASINRVGVPSFAPDNRYGWFPTFGAGWILSEEDFLSNVRFLNYLKIRASYGVLGSTTYDENGSFSTHLYEDVWYENGTIDLGGKNYLVPERQEGNENLGFQKSYELNVGIDAQLFNKSTRVTLGYFNNVNADMIVTKADMIPGVSGLNEALCYWNYNKFGLKGVEGEIWYNHLWNNVEFNLGANFTYGITKRIVDAEPDYPAGYEGLRLEGRPVDAIMGLETAGTFKDEADIEGSPAQMFGTVRPGDIKYVDTNNDGYIDERDQKEIGNSSPRLQFGLNFNVQYKGFSLSALAMGYGKYQRLLNTQYYQIYGDRKYSRVVIDGLPNGNPQPQLSVKSNGNNFVNSTYWIVNGSFLKLRNAELAYTLPHELTQKKLKVNTVKFFTRGTNLLTLSKIKDLDPENLTAGVGNFPLATTLTLGFSVSF